MQIIFLEPFDTGSHGRWMRGYQAHSQHDIHILSLEGQFWQWRLLGGAVTLAEQFLALEIQPDLIIASDMLDLTTFLALTRPITAHLPIAIYFHENQLTYPFGPRQKLGNHYAFINYVSALAADKVYFNSQFHCDVFLDELPRLLKHFPDHNNLATIDTLREKSTVLPIGLNLQRYDAYQDSAPKRDVPLILWNHRWEYDKNPEPFLNALLRLADEGINFEVVLAGENQRQEPTEFLETQAKLGERVIHFGYVESFADYARYLWSADVMVSTSQQDFFGISVVEAIYCGCYPLLANRLNYPYLIPAEYHAEMLFPTDAGLYYLLKAYLLNPRPTPPELRKFVSQFDWQHLTPHYDEIFREMKKINE